MKRLFKILSLSLITFTSCSNTASFVIEIEAVQQVVPDNLTYLRFNANGWLSEDLYLSLYTYNNTDYLYDEENFGCVMRILNNSENLVTIAIKDYYLVDIDTGNKVNFLSVYNPLGDPEEGIITHANNTCEINFYASIPDETANMNFKIKINKYDVTITKLRNTVYVSD